MTSSEIKTALTPAWNAHLEYIEKREANESLWTEDKVKRSGIDRDMAYARYVKFKTATVYAHLMWRKAIEEFCGNCGDDVTILWLDNNTCVVNGVKFEKIKSAAT